MKKAQLPQDESLRLSILHDFQVLDTPSEKVFDDITHLASKICDTPISLISFIDTDRQWFKSKVGLGAEQTPRDISFCGHAIFNNEVFEIPDARLDERFADNPLVTGDPNVAFYAGAPLITWSGHKIGTLCVIDQKAKKLTLTQIEVLESLAKQVINILELKRRDRDLSTALEEMNLQRKWTTSVINAARYSIIATDPEGNITTFNRGAERMLGYASHEVIGKNPAIFHDLDEVVARAKVLTKELGWVVEVGFDVFVVKSSLSEDDINEWSYIRKDGSRFPVELCVSCVKDGNKIIGFMGIATDLSERKQAEDEKINLQLELEQQTKLAFHNAKLATIGQLAAGVGHEINNPLGIVKGLTEIIEESLKCSGYENEKVFSKISRIYDAVERISSITTGLRSYSRIDDAQINDFCVYTLAKDTVEMLSEMFHSEGVSLEFNASANANELKIRGNPGRLQQVLVNLISNAKDSSEGMPIRNVVLRLESGEKNIDILIQDNGRGIPDDIQRKIFDPFFTTKDLNKGTGIGLSLVSTIVNEHAGKLSFESKMGLGTTFKVSLPLVNRVMTLSSNNAESSTQKNVRPLEGMKILFVDDEEDLREVIQYHLVHWGGTVETAENGKIALEMIKKIHYDLIISDITMPVMDGFELLEKFLELDTTKKTKFMFITGGALKGYDKLDRVLDKLDGLLSKPFKTNAVLEKLKELFPVK